MKEPIKVAIVGYGQAGQLHAQAIRRLSHLFSLVAIADIKPPLASTINGERVYQDYHRLLSDTDVDAISICTRPSDHYGQALACLRAANKKHLLVEKPPALEVGQCRELAQLAGETGVTLYLSHHTAMISAVTTARLLLAGRKVTGIEALHLDQASNLHAHGKWTFDPGFSGGGVLMDCGINIMSAVMAVLPTVQFTPTRARFSGPSSLQVETTAEVDFSFGEGGSGHLTMDWENPTNTRRIRFTVSDGESITVDTVRGRLFRDGVVVPEFKDSTNSLSEEYQFVYTDFASHITNKESSVDTRPLDFVLQAYRKAKDTH